LFYINLSRRDPAVPGGGPGYPPVGVAPSGGEGRIPSPSERRTPGGSGRGLLRSVKELLGNAVEL